MKEGLKKRTVILIGGLILVVSLVYVKITINMYQLSYEINENLKQKKELEDKNRKLKIETASLKSPSRIEQVAGQKLSLKSDSGAKTVIMDKYDTQGN